MSAAECGDRQTDMHFASRFTKKKLFASINFIARTLINSINYMHLFLTFPLFYCVYTDMFMSRL
jgi:hypothetical protein